MGTVQAYSLLPGGTVGGTFGNSGLIAMIIGCMIFSESLWYLYQVFSMLWWSWEAGVVVLVLLFVIEENVKSSSGSVSPKYKVSMKSSQSDGFLGHV